MVTRHRLLVAAIVSVAACGGGNGPDSAVERADIAVDGLGVAPERGPLTAPGVYVERGDIEAIRAHGTVRMANVALTNLEELPSLRWGMPSEDDVAREFADRLGLELVIEDFPSDRAAEDALLAGLVDGIVGRSGAGVALPPEGIAFSTPFRTEPGVIIGRAGEVPETLAGLADRTVSFAPNSRLLGLGPELKRQYPRVTIDTVDVVTVEDKLDLLLEGDAELGLVERWMAEAVVEAHPELEIGPEFGAVEYNVAVRAANPDLLRLVNDFAFQFLPVGDGEAELLGDLDEIRSRRVLRVLTVNGPSSYYVYKGELVGFDLDLVRMFADEQNLIVQMVVAPSTEYLEPWLERGLGDMIGVGIVPSTIVDSVRILATRPYHDVDPVVIVRSELGLTSLENLEGREVVVARNNPYLTAVEAEATRLGARLQITSDAESTHQLLDRLERGDADLTVLESHLADAELPDHPSLAVLERLEGQGRAWAVRDDQPELLAALNGFFDRVVDRTTYAVLVRKYFRRDTRRVEQPELREDGSLSPFDDIVRRHASETRFDWRLLTAQMFQESRFDPRARSPVGAYGLMQLMPQTARQMGVRDLSDPEEQVRAGVQYMEWLYNRFPSRLSQADRVAFTLAAYNAGWGHVSDARRVAELNGRDPDRWFDHVEISMLNLSDPDYYRFTRHGYVRGSEPVRYVRRINELGQMYYRLAPN